MVASAPAPRIYRLCGLTLSSCIDLPGVACVDPLSGVPDVAIVWDSVPESLRNPSHCGPNWAVAHDEFLLSVPGVARFLVRGGREVVMQSDPGRDPADLAAFLVATVLGVLLHQRGCLLFHAAAVAVGDSAVLFCGPSGAGKSVLAAAFSTAGYPLLCDEICSVQIEGPSAVATPDGRSLKLWSDTISRLSLGSRQGAAVRPGLQKYWVNPPTPSARRPLPLRAIYSLHGSPLHDRPAIEPASLLDAIAMLRVHAYRRRLIPALGRQQVWLDGCASIASRVPFWNLTRRMQFDSLPACVALLERHWGP